MGGDKRFKARWTDNFGGWRRRHQ